VPVNAVSTSLNSRITTLTRTGVRSTTLLVAASAAGAVPLLRAVLPAAAAAAAGLAVRALRGATGAGLRRADVTADSEPGSGGGGAGLRRADVTPPVVAAGRAVGDAVMELRRAETGMAGACDAADDDAADDDADSVPASGAAPSAACITAPLAASDAGVPSAASARSRRTPAPDEPAEV